MYSVEIRRADLVITGKTPQLIEYNGLITETCGGTCRGACTGRHYERSTQLPAMCLFTWNHFSVI